MSLFEEVYHKSFCVDLNAADALQGATGQASVNPAFQDTWSSDED